MPSQAMGQRWIPGSYGNFLRAWRLGLSPNDSVTISRTQFLTACSNLGFKDAGKAPWPGNDVGLSDPDPGSSQSPGWPLENPHTMGTY